MKSYAASTGSATKQRRWKWLALAVLALVFFSMFVPLAFLLGLYNGFPVGYLSEESPPSNFFDIHGHGGVAERNASEVIVKGADGDGDMNLNNSKQVAVGEQHISKFTSGVSHSRSEMMATVLSVFSGIDSEGPSILNPKFDSRVGVKLSDSSNYVGAQKTCELEFGTYCLWSKEHKEAMKDIIIKRLKDQLFVSRAYYPSIAKLLGHETLSHEMKQNIQEHERMLSEATSDTDLPPFVPKKIKQMKASIAKAKACTVECSNVERKLRQILDLTEEETHFHMKQSAFLYHLVVQSMPKSLHCLSMRLTMEYFQEGSPSDADISHFYKFNNPKFRHYVIFSRDVLAVSVTVNSTVMSSKDTADIVFHLITDRQNFYAMKFWFARHFYMEATIRVVNIEDLYPGMQLSPSEEFRISVHDIDHPHSLLMRTEYMSVFGHSHFLLPEIFKDLKKLIVLDDDMIVQQDLTHLWNTDLAGKVNGAVSFCRLRLGDLKAFLGRNSIHDCSLCLWTSGLNVIHLENWRQHNLTGTYLELLGTLHNGSEGGATLPASLLVFQGHVFPLDGSSVIISGLGHEYGVDEEAIKSATALHYNGNMKPWLDLGIPEYKKYWKKFLAWGPDRFMDECNVSH